VKFGLKLSQMRMPFEEVVSRARLADDLGFEGIWGFDHLQPMGPGDSLDVFDANTTLAALSGRTERVRLGILVTGMTYRHPAVLAAEAITIDHASNGRFDLGYGAGWFEPEHKMFGIPFPSIRERIDAFEEALQIVKGLFTTDGFSFEGKHFSVQDATMRPRPVQQPHPPILVGMNGGPRMSGIIARHADAWHMYGQPDQLIPVASRVDELAADAGRDPASILRVGTVDLGAGWDGLTGAADAAGDWDALAATIDAFRNAGWGYLIFMWPPGGRADVEKFAARFLGA
jgi:alkanesulfonate monooxygenase SsuD/methylene tetrahydromethanopterin reductase-like flavin-dependent oxidoreductase (luciferase family)